MKYDFVTIGGSTEDIAVYTDEGKIIENPDDVLAQKLFAFEYGAKLKVEKAYSTFGGGASNAAVNLAKLGFKVAPIVALGEDDRANRIIENFKTHKVFTELVQKYKGEDSGFSFLLVGTDNEHVVFSHRAANKKLKIGAPELKLLDSAKWIYMTSLSGRWLEVLANVFKSKAKIAWNPGHIQLHKGIGTIGKYLSKTDMMVVNKDEAIELIVSDKNYRNKDNSFFNQIKNLLIVLKGFGPKIVVVTNGKLGADAFDGQKFYHQDVIKERRRMDTTGVGDAFGSTFIAGLEMFNGDIRKAMYASAKNTASVISLQGAQNGLLSKSVIVKAVKKIK